MTTPDAYDGYMSLLPEGYVHPNKVAARVALRIPFYYPGRSAAALECPALFCVAMKDSVAPSRSTIWHVRKARKGRIKRYRTGHFDLYLEPWFDEVVADQIEFLRDDRAGRADAESPPRLAPSRAALRAHLRGWKLCVSHWSSSSRRPTRRPIVKTSGLESQR